MNLSAPIYEIENKWIRRLYLILAFPIAVLIALVIGAISGIINFAQGFYEELYCKYWND